MFVPASVDGIGSLNQLALAALAQWLTRDYANDPSAVPPIVALSGPVSITQAGAVTDVIYTSAGVALSPQRALISASTTGATQIVAAVASKKIRVLTGFLVASAAVNVKFQSHVTPTDLTGLMSFAANGGLAIPYCELGHLDTVAGEALDINLSGAVAVGGAITYVAV